MKKITLIALSVFSLNAFAGFDIPSIPKTEVNVKDATLQAGLEVCADKLALDPNNIVTVMAMNEAIKSLAEKNDDMGYSATVGQFKEAAKSFDTEKCNELSLGL